MYWKEYFTMSDVIASVVGSLAFGLFLQIIGVIIFMVYKKCSKQQSEGENDKSPARISIISEIQPYGDITQLVRSSAPDTAEQTNGPVEDMVAYATSNDVTQGGSEIVYYKESSVANPEAIYYKETKVEVPSGGIDQHGGNVEVASGNIYQQGSKVGDMVMVNTHSPHPQDVVEYAIPDMTRKKSRKENKLKMEDTQEGGGVLGGTVSTAV